MDNKKVGEIYKQLDALHQAGRIPVKEIGITQFKRWQREKQKSGVFFGTPSDPSLMGRYNDPTAKTGVCFVADYAVTAIAEAYGREYQNKTDEFSIGLDEVSKAQICTLETTRKTCIINMPRLQSLLHITADKIMGDDQGVTRAVTDWAANTKGLFYDGINYISRHLGVGTCTAYWQPVGGHSPLKDVDMISLSRFVDDNEENFPQNWPYKDINGFEILTEALGFTVVNNSEDDE